MKIFIGSERTDASMNEITKIHHKKLGELSYMKGPQKIHCWSGSIDDCEEGFSIVLSNPDIESADIDFICGVVSNRESHIKKAINFIKIKLNTEPEVFGLEKSEQPYPTSDNIPVDLPRFVFYEKHEFTIVFGESSLPIGDPYGIGVAFDDEQPITIEDFSEAEIIDDDE